MILKRHKIYFRQQKRNTNETNKFRSNVTGECQCGYMISINLNSVSPVNLLHIYRGSV